MAAAGKPPHFSPQKIIDEIRRRVLSVSNDQYETVKGLPPGWDAASIRERLITALDSVEGYILTAPVDLVGILSVDLDATPVEAYSLDDGNVSFSRATSEPEVMPSLPEASQEWKSRP